MSSRLASTLSYLFFPAIAFLVLEPYKRDTIVRAHAIHCLFIAGAGLVVSVALSILSFVCGAVGLYSVTMILSGIFSLAALGLTVVLMLKAWNGDMLKLPVITEKAMGVANR